MSIIGYWWVLAIIGVIMFFVLHRWTFRLFGIALIPEDSLGIVNKAFVLFGKNRSLPDGRIVALQGEAGIQAETLAPGIYFCYWPWQYQIKIQKFTTVAEGYIGIVEARDGNALPAGRILAKRVDCDMYQDVRSFMERGGERGPQITVIPPGTYRVNTDVFTINDVRMVEIPDNMVGIVTTKEGKPLASGEIAGPVVNNHNMFQDAQAFIDGGGCKGLQEQVILSGRYYLNPLFVTIEIKEMTIVPIANAGVVISYVGKEGQDVTGEKFQHGNMVNRGERGVCVTPLDPGKYPINPYTHKVECVPTANIVLNWATGKTESHNLDKNLSTITVRSSDGFKFNLDVSQIIHIPRNQAPLVVARFGKVENLVTQVLEPTIGNYFRNSAQGSDVITFLRERQERQQDAKKRIGEALQEYNVVAVDTLIGDIVPPDDLMKTLTDRKLAEQEKITFETQKQAEETRKEFQQAKAMADTQPDVVKSERRVAIAQFEASAAIEKAKGDAQSKTINVEADAAVIEKMGAAEAGKIEGIGKAEANVIKLKIESMHPENFAAVEIARALSVNKIKLVPDIQVAGSNGNGLMDVLLAQMALGQSKKPIETEEIGDGIEGKATTAAN